MANPEESEPSTPSEPESDPGTTNDRPQIPSNPRPELLNPQTEGLDRAPEIKDNSR